MNLKLISHTFTDNSTISDLFIDGIFECKILEPTWRGSDNANHVLHKTAINSGLYNVVIDFSNRFQRMMPHILCAIDYAFGAVTLNTAGVRQHWGNKPENTEACQLLGDNESKDFVGDSVKTFGIYFPKLESAIKNGEKIILLIDRSQSTLK